MSTTDIWCGAVTPTSVWVRGKVSGASVRLAIATNAAFTGATYFGPSAPVANIASIEATGLTANTAYYYAFEVDAVLDTAIAGEFRTDPVLGTPTSFKIISASCADGRYDADAGSIYSQSSIYATMAAFHPTARRFISTGDLHYLDNEVNVEANYLAAYDAVLASTQSALFRKMALAYTWDDHDFCGNNSFGTAVAKPAVQTAYRKRVPHYPLEEANAIYHSFQIGRVLFIMSDTRSERSDPAATDDASKTMLGSAQKAWFLDLLDTTDAAAIVWVQSSPWIALDAAIQDSWGQFTTERAELATAIEDYADRGAFCILSGDIHTLAMDDGTNNVWGGFPVFQFAAMDGEGNYRGGPYSHGRSMGIRRYGALEFDDNGSRIIITGIGYIARNHWRRHSFAFPVETVIPPFVPQPVTRLY